MEASATLPDVEQLRAKRKRCETKLAKATKKIATIDAEIAQRKHAATLAEMKARGTYTFTDTAFLQLLENCELWRAIGTVNRGNNAAQSPPLESECPEVNKCMNNNCRFRQCGVKAEPDVSLWHFMDAAHKICITVCHYCRASAPIIAQNTKYWHANCDDDDGYGGRTDWNVRAPFCSIPCGRALTIKGEAEVARLAYLRREKAK